MQIRFIGGGVFALGFFWLSTVVMAHELEEGDGDSAQRIPSIDARAAIDVALPILRPTTIRTVFRIAKSQNRNELHFGVRVDGQCRPLADEPVFAYWRMLEQGPEVVEEMTRFERRYFGLVAPPRVGWTIDGGEVEFALRGFPERRMTVQIGRGSSGCEAHAVTSIDGWLSHLDEVWIEFGGPMSIDYVELRGRAVALDDPGRTPTDERSERIRGDAPEI